MRYRPALAASAVALLVAGYWFAPWSQHRAVVAQNAAPSGSASVPTVTVAEAGEGRIEERVLVTGTLVPRLEVLVAPEVEGLRLIELLADDGDRVVKGQVLARLERQTLEAQKAQISANLVRADAAIAQARSNIASAEAHEVEAQRAYDRAKPLRVSGAMAEAVLDQRESAAKTARAATQVARDGLGVAEADRAQLAAQSRDIDWKLGKTEVRSPADGVISRRDARIGGIASANVMGMPMFRLIADGEVELEAEVPEADLARLSPGQTAEIVLPGAGGTGISGKVRLVSPEIDKATRQGRVRIALPGSAHLAIGSFARGTVLTRSKVGLSVPASAVLRGADGASVQVVRGSRIETRKVETGLSTGERIEIVTGLVAGDRVVARAGTFLRDGDSITPVATDVVQGTR